MTTPGAMVSRASTSCAASRTRSNMTSPPPSSPPAAASVQRRAVVVSAPLVSIASIALATLKDRASAVPLAPLGKVSRVGAKRINLNIEEIKDILESDLSQGQYFINPGGLTTEIFADNCRFKDPTNDVVGLSRYLKALELLFDPSRSKVTLKSIRVSGPKQITAEWTLGGFLKFAWNPCVKTFTGKAIYTLNDEGLIQKQEQEWSKSAEEALRESFTPCRYDETLVV
mmetsp:Transcript_398/g.915  ORF Transcript_398/g.915 Transcript_398/m.915 type:complete len:228 (+) Transcript_398:157-840(+)